jgi:hypothetical protein
MVAPMNPSPTAPAGRSELTRRHRRKLGRWIIPVGGALLSALLIVIATPHVAWYLRVGLGLITFLYIGGQSAAYLWSSHHDQG